MKILIFGAGAMGSLFGGLLAQKYDVTLLGRKAHVEAIKRNGLKISGKTNLISRPKALASTRNRFDLVILTVKSYDTTRAAKQLKKIVTKKTIILSIQNGLGNEEILSSKLGKQNILRGVTEHGVTFLKPGKIYHSGAGATVIGELDGKITGRIKKLADSFNSVGIKTRVAKDVLRELWLKTIINACINPLTALTGLRNGAVLEPELRCVAEQTCREAVEVATSLGLNFSYAPVIKKVKQVAKNTAKNKSSMLQDIEKGKLTEIDFINCKIVELGEKFGISTPVNSTLVALVKSLERRK